MLYQYLFVYESDLVIHIYALFKYYFPLWKLHMVLCGRTLLVFHSKCLTVCIHQPQSPVLIPLPSSLSLGSHKSDTPVRESVSVLQMIGSFVLISDFIYNWYHMIFVFTQYDNLSVPSQCHKWHYLFFFMAEKYSIVCMYHIFFILSSANEHLGCFMFWLLIIMLL